MGDDYDYLKIWFKGRLLKVTTRNGYFDHAEVLRGRPFPFKLHCGGGYWPHHGSQAQKRAVRKLEVLTDRRTDAIFQKWLSGTGINSSGEG